MEPVFYWLGRSIGDRQRYKIRKHLHSTRMSSVYAAVDRMTRERVIIKIADSRFQVHDSVQYLKVEAQVIQALNHSRIVRLLDCGDLDEGYFLTLEYLEGKDLDEYINDSGPLLPEEAIQIVVQILEAVEYIHDQSELHGDIKSSNIIVLGLGGIKVIDFGLSRCRLPGTIGFGTDGYTAPEQSQGLNMDRRSDLYSAGVVLYEALTDKSPFFGFDSEDKEEKFKDYWNHTRPFPEQLHIPTKVQEIVWKALQIDPDLRFQTAKEMREVLAEALLSLPY